MQKLSEVSKNLVFVCNSILAEHQQGAGEMDYSSNGKRYRLTPSGKFIRVRREQNHLIVASSYEEYQQNISIVSAYSILKNQGDVLTKYKDLCLAIIFCAREIELNKWYDESSSMVCTLQTSKYNPMDLESEALDYIKGVSPQLRQQYINIAAMMITGTKINFFQTDHNVLSPELDGYVLRRMVSETCGGSALTDVDVYNSLRAFSYWISIKGVFHCLNIPGLSVDDQTIHNFKCFPKIPTWVGETIRNRYPAGCSTFAIIKKCLIMLSQSIYGEYIPMPVELDLGKFMAICKDIENDPLRYHVRAVNMELSVSVPVAVNQTHPTKKWLECISCWVHAIGGVNFDQQLSQSSKLAPVGKVKGLPLFKSTKRIVTNVNKGDKNRIKPAENSIRKALDGLDIEL